MRENLFSLAYIIVIMILSHLVGERLPRRWFHWASPPFASFGFERDGDIYDRIHIKKWKKKLPDLSRLNRRMVPKRVTFRASAAEIERLLRELCVAETVHIALYFLSFGVLLIGRTWFCIALCVLYALGNIPFILIQRYNRPHIARLLARVTEAEEMQKKQTNP